MIIGIEATHANKEKRTGVEEYCFELIKHFKSIIPKEVEVHLYSNKPLLDELKNLPDNWVLKILPWPLSKGWSQIRLSLYFLSHPQPDVFFAPGQLVPLICPKNTVTTIHDSAFKVYPRVYRFFGRQYLKLMNYLILKKSKLIITPSDFSKNELHRLYKHDLEKIKKVFLGFNQEDFKPRTLDLETKKSLLKKYKIEKDFIMFVGRLEEKKNLVNMIKSFSFLREKLDLNFVLVGSTGCGFDLIEKTIAESKYKDDIKICGWVTEQDLPLLYNEAKALFYVSRYEGFGLPLLHALASGCPAVVSKGNSLEEVGGEAVLLADPSSITEMTNKIFELLSNEELKNKLIKIGLNKAKDFSWQKTAQNIWQILLKVKN